MHFLLPRHAHYSLGNFNAASSAFQRGLLLDSDNVNLKSGLEQAEARISDETPPPLDRDEGAPVSGAGGGMPDLGGLASMLGGMGGGAGGMPDISGMMNNPGFMQMAQNMMANGGMERLMQNPAIAGMVGPIVFRVLSSGG